MASTKVYRYTLQPYKRQSDRFTCPSCGVKREFSRYVDTATGDYLGEHVGRCNREDNCGHHFTPSQHFANGGEKPTQDWTPPPPQPELPGYRMKREQVRQTMKEAPPCKLVSYLSTILDPVKVKQAAFEYCVGTYTEPGYLNGAAIFWQVDRTGEVRTGKVIQYDSSTGHRIHNAENWSHTLCGGIPEGYMLEQCLYGAHLLDKYPNAPVGIVEAEKTALVARILVPSVLWVATGGLGELKTSKALPLAGRNVTLWPDLGKGFVQWTEKAEQLEPLFESLKVVDLLERVATDAERAKGLDLADYLLSAGSTEVLTSRPVAPMSQQVATNVKTFIDKYNLQGSMNILDIDLTRARITSL